MYAHHFIPITNLHQPFKSPYPPPPTLFFPSYPPPFHLSSAAASTENLGNGLCCSDCCSRLPSFLQVLIPQQDPVHLSCYSREDQLPQGEAVLLNPLSLVA